MVPGLARRGLLLSGIALVARLSLSLLPARPSTSPPRTSRRSTFSPCGGAQMTLATLGYFCTVPGHLRCGMATGWERHSDRK
jgi:hypothetical protein